MTDYPASLRYVKVELGGLVQEKMDEIQDYNIDGEVRFEPDAFETGLESLDLSNMHDQWYDKFRGGCYYCGILNLEPWDLLDRYEEETIWEFLVQHHLVFDTAWPYTMTFRHNDKSPIGKFLRRYTSYGDVATNVQSVFCNAAKTVFALDERQHDPSLWSFHDYGWCPKCDVWAVGVGRWLDCPECGGELYATSEEAENDTH